MNSKEQKIKAEYGEYYEACNPDNQGWSSVDEALGGYEFLDENIEYFDFESSGKWRPKSLQGIENNNGWIKIESEDDLPKESGWYDFQVYPQAEYKPNNVFWHAGATKIGWYVETYTHYQKTESKLPPLY